MKGKPRFNPLKWGFRGFAAGLNLGLPFILALCFIRNVYAIKY